MSDSVFLDEITYFRLAASSPQAFERSIKVVTGQPDDKIRQLDLVLRRHQDEAVIVFCEFEETADVLLASLKERKAFLITGSVPVFEREERIARFRESGSGVLVMTSVGGEGLDLQFASVLVNYDLTWNPMVLEQRVGRIDRIGQEKETIHVYNFLVEGSIDERIIRVLGEKLGLLAGSVLEPSSLLSNTSDSQDDLFFAHDLEGELSQAETLAKSLELSKAIIPDDYRIIEAVDEEYCAVERMAEAGASGDGVAWLKNSDIAKSWRESVISSATRLTAAIQLYS
jgi:SNF2 family DNA or RNA helicase